MDTNVMTGGAGGIIWEECQKKRKEKKTWEGTHILRARGVKGRG